MPKYFDADELLKKLPDDLPYKSSVKRVLMQAPAADVVPKSEVLKDLENFEDYINGVRKGCDFLGKTYPKSLFGCIYERVAELKKKYTVDKDCTTCKHLASCEPNIFGSCEEYEENNIVL